MSDWQPIATAPADKMVLIRSRAGYIATAEYHTFGWALARSYVGGDDGGFGGPYYLRDEWEPVEWYPTSTHTD